MKTKSEVADLVQCPDCGGHGTHNTPSKNWNRAVICAVCRGAGYITRLHAYEIKKAELADADVLPAASAPPGREP